jgi:hypothetical protein
MWIYTSTPLYAFMVYCLISRAQGQLYLLPSCHILQFLLISCYIFPVRLSEITSTLIVQNAMHAFMPSFLCSLLITQRITQKYKDRTS